MTIGFKKTKIGPIPEDWDVSRIEDINKARFDSMNPANSSQEIFEYYSIPAYQESFSPYIERGSAILSNKLVVKPNTVLFGKLNPRVLKVWFVRPSSAYRQIASTEFLPILPNEKAVPMFIYYLCQSSIVAENSKQYAVGTTPSRQRVNPKAFYNMLIPLPPLPEQRKIAEIISMVDETIEKTDAIIEETRQLKKGLMQKLFTEGIGHTRFKETKIGRIPEDWEIRRLGDLIREFKGGASLTPNDFMDEGVKVLPKVGVIPGGVLTIADDKQQYCSKEYAKANRNAMVNKESLIVVLRDLVPSGPSIGLIVRIPNEETYILAQGVYGIKIDETNLVADFLVQLSNSPWYRKYMQRILIGSTQVHIRNSEFRKVLIPYPSVSEQHKIAKTLSEIDAKIELEQVFRTELEQLKKGLMQVLLTGKVRVKINGER